MIARWRLRIKRRQGSKRAFVAVAASMLTAACYMLQRDEDVRDLAAGYFDQFDRQKLAQRLVRRLDEIGLAVQVQPRAGTRRFRKSGRTHQELHLLPTRRLYAKETIPPTTRRHGPRHSGP